MTIFYMLNPTQNLYLTTELNEFVCGAFTMMSRQ